MFSVLSMGEGIGNWVLILLNKMVWPHVRVSSLNMGPFKYYIMPRKWEDVQNLIVIYFFDARTKKYVTGGGGV